jgi:hypothetical protein
MGDEHARPLADRRLIDGEISHETRAVGLVFDVAGLHGTSPEESYQSSVVSQEYRATDD